MQALPLCVKPLLQLATLHVPYAEPVQVCEPVPSVMVQLRVSLTQAPLSRWKFVLQVVGAQVDQLVEPALQLCEPVPLVTAQLCEPAGLEQVCEVAEAPQTAESVGVQAWVVTTVPQLVGVPLGVQLCDAAGAAAAHDALDTVSPKLSTQLMARDCVPLPASNTQEPERD